MDNSGCLFILKGFPFEREINLVGLYLPNENLISNLETFIDKINQNKECSPLIRGGCNVVFGPLLDVSKGASYLTYSKLRTAMKLLHYHHLVDT